MTKLPPSFWAKSKPTDAVTNIAILLAVLVFAFVSIRGVLQNYDKFPKEISNHMLYMIFGWSTIPLAIFSYRRHSRLQKWHIELHYVLMYFAIAAISLGFLEIYGRLKFKSYHFYFGSLSVLGVVLIGLYTSALYWGSKNFHDVPYFHSWHQVFGLAVYASTSIALFFGLYMKSYTAIMGSELWHLAFKYLVVFITVGVVSKYHVIAFRNSYNLLFPTKHE